MWLCKRPRILTFPNFLSREECLRIIHLAKAKGMQADSPVTDSPQSIRTSSSCWLAYNKNEQDYGCETQQDQVMMRSIADRISMASCIPEDHGESFQILRYLPGQRYRQHSDYFTKYQKEELAMGGQRLATMILYLSDVPKGGGGETHFPRIRSFQQAANSAQRHPDNGTLMIPPQAGMGLLFFNVGPENRTETTSIHESLPVQAGHEKWIMTRWIREKKYPRPSA